MKVVFVGMGGTNSWLARPLLKAMNSLNRDGSNTVTIIDGDKYDSGNFERQEFSLSNLSVNKAEAKAKELKPEFTNMQITAVSKYLSQKDVDYYIQDGDIVMVAVDCMKTRKVIDDHAKTLNNVLLISMGNEMMDGDVFVYCKVDGKELTPSLQIDHPEISNAKQPSRSEMSCEQIAALPSGGQLIFANLQAATLGLAMFWKFMADTELLTKSNPIDVRGAYFDNSKFKMVPVTIN